jgi:hypothetical protein
MNPLFRGRGNVAHVVFRHLLMNIELMLVLTAQAIRAAHTSSTSFPHDTPTMFTRLRTIKPHADMRRFRAQVILDNKSNIINQDFSTGTQRRQTHNKQELIEKRRTRNSSRPNFASHGRLVQRAHGGVTAHNDKRTQQNSKATMSASTL